MTRRILFLLLLLAGLGLTGCGPAREERVVVGSKNFTEQLILGELVAQHLEIGESHAARRFAHRRVHARDAGKGIAHDGQ